MEKQERYVKTTMDIFDQLWAAAGAHKLIGPDSLCMAQPKHLTKSQTAIVVMDTATLSLNFCFAKTIKTMMFVTTPMEAKIKLKVKSRYISTSLLAYVLT